MKLRTAAIVMSSLYPIRHGEGKLASAGKLHNDYIAA